MPLRTPKTLAQLTHLHASVHGTSELKHSQYFLRQDDFLHRQPPKERRGREVATAIAWARSAACCSAGVLTQLWHAHSGLQYSPAAKQSQYLRDGGFEFLSTAWGTTCWGAGADFLMQRECLQRHPEPLFGVAAAAQADSGACRFAARSVEPGCSCAGDRIVAELRDRDEPAGLGAAGDAPGVLRFLRWVHLGIVGKAKSGSSARVLILSRQTD